VDSLTGWVGTLNLEHVLYATNDGGRSWTEVTNLPEPGPLGVCGMAVVNDSVVFAAGRYDGPARMIKTTDGGMTWAEKKIAEGRYDMQGIYFVRLEAGKQMAIRKIILLQ